MTPPNLWLHMWHYVHQEDPLEEAMAIHPVFLPGEYLGQRSLESYSTFAQSGNE